MRNLSLNISGSPQSHVADIRAFGSKFFAVFISVVMALTLSPVSAFTASASASSVDDAASKVEGASVPGDKAEAAAGLSMNDQLVVDVASDSGISSYGGSLNNADADDEGSNAAIATVDAGDDTLAPGKYGRYTYRQNAATNAFESSEYDAYRDPVATEWLGIAGSFHIAAFNQVNICSHVYGNILTKTLNGSNNFGPTSEYGNRYGYQTLSYVQNYPNPSGNPDGKDDGVFIIGSNNVVTKVDNGNHLSINGAQLNSPNTLIQDIDTDANPFIDLDAVKVYTTKVSDDLAKVADTGATVRQQGGNTYIDYEGESGCAYVSMTADELNSIDQLFINGMTLNGECSVVINVDMNGATQLNLSKVHVLLPNGQTAGTGESDNTVGYVMFNIKNSTSDMNINLSDRVLASVLAPNSTINLGGSAAGTYIATNVNVTAESHARPFRGTLKPITDSLSVKKVWQDAYGNAEPVDVVDAHGAVSVKVYQRSKVTDGEWSDWREYEIVTLSKDNGWSKLWASVPKKDADGTVYEYKMAEVSQTADYVSSVENSGGAWTIVNRHVAVGKLSVSKVWKDAAGNVESGEHGEVTVKVMRSVNGTDFEQYGESISLSERNNWSASVEPLPLKDSAGNDYIYKVQEDNVAGYAVSYDGSLTPDIDDFGNKIWTYTVTNTHEAEGVSFSLSGYSAKSAAAPVSEPDKICYVDPKIVKVLDGRTLTAGEFSFQLIDEKGSIVSEAKNDAAGMVDFDAAQNVAKEGMEPSCLAFTAAGTYTYTVRETPNQVKDPSVEYSDEIIKFVTVIDTDDKGALYEKESYYLKYDNAADAAAGVGATKYASDDHPSITNKVKAVSLGLKKTSAETGEGLEGAVYALYKVDESAPEGFVQVMTATSNQNGFMVFSSDDASVISVGEKYFFREITAPEGYTVSENRTEAFTLEQVDDGKYQLAYESGEVSAAASGTVDDPVVYKAGAGVSDTQVSVTFGKIASDGTALCGAELAIRDASGNEVDAWTTDGNGHVVKSLAIDTEYVLYEKTAPVGYKKADEVTFTVDKYGNVTIVSGGGSDGALNAYATGSNVNLVDYRQNEIVEKKEVSREEGVSSNANKQATSPKTGDGMPSVPLAVLAIGSSVAAAFAARKLRANG